MLRFGSYLLWFYCASDWSWNNEHSRNFLWCSRFHGKDCKILFKTPFCHLQRRAQFNRGQWLSNPTNFFVVGFCSLFWPWPCTKHNIIAVYWGLLTNRIIIKTCWLHNSCIVYEDKTKDCAGSWTFQPKSWHHSLLLWCLWGFIIIPHNLLTMPRGSENWCPRILNFFFLNPFCFAGCMQLITATK